MRTTLGLLALMCVAGCTPADERAGPPARPAPPSAPPPDPRQVARDYKHLIPMTAQPVPVSSATSTLCEGVGAADPDAASRRYGPHADRAVRIYMNGAAAAAFGTSAGSYPAGSVIVKEKLDLRAVAAGSPPDVPPAPVGVGGMIKRPAGYDPGRGDWEYFYAAGPSSAVESGRIATCVQCHAGGATRDHVFGGWANGY